MTGYTINAVNILVADLQPPANHQPLLNHEHDDD